MKNALLVLFLFVFAASLFAQNKTTAKNERINVQITKRTESTATFSFQNPDKALIYFVLSTIPTNLTQIDKDILSLEKTIKLDPQLLLSKDVYLIVTSKQEAGDYTITGLVGKTKYEFAVYKRIDNKKVEKVWFTDMSTLAKEPTEQATNIAFSDVTENSFKVSLFRGNGEKRIVVVTKGNETNTPIDGVRYFANPNYGSKDNKIGSGYVVYNGGDRMTDLVVNNLENGEYTVQVFEYNGEGEAANYLTKTASNNPRKFKTLLPAPKALEPEFITHDGIVAKWTKVNGAITYFLDIATDKEFNNRLELYADLDVGDIDEIEVVDLESNQVYYFRVRAVAPGNKSKYSNTIQFKTK
mgnify:CR=1 FL=1